LRSVVKEFPISAIHEARQAFLDNVDDGDEYDVVYEIVDVGKMMVEEFLKEDDAKRGEL
jgi:hypothetical protein